MENPQHVGSGDTVLQKPGTLGATYKLWRQWEGPSALHFSKPGRRVHPSIKPPGQTEALSSGLKGVWGEEGYQQPRENRLFLLTLAFLLL